MTSGKRVFRDYVVALVAQEAVLPRYVEMLAPLGFKRLHPVMGGDSALLRIIEQNPDLIVTVGPEFGTDPIDLLDAVRMESETAETPFLLVDPVGALAEDERSAVFDVASPAAIVTGAEEPDGLLEAITNFLDPLIDPNLEAAYALMDQAADASSSGDQEAAVDLYHQALARYGHFEAWMSLADIQVERKRFEDAESAFLGALEANKYNLNAYIRLAELYEGLDRHEQALGILQQALGIAMIIKASGRAKADLTVFIGKLDLNLQRLAAAEKAFERAVAHSPDDAEVRSDIGDAYAENGHYQEAEDYYQAALELDPNLAHVFNKLGIAYRRQAKYEKALEFYANARTHHPDDEHLLFNMARTYHDLKQYSAAITLLEECLKLSPNFKAARIILQRLKGDKKFVDLDIADDMDFSGMST